MGALEPGTVVLVRFLFSDLSASKFRPAVVLAHSSGPDWILCQVTSKPYGDPRSISLLDEVFASGGLHRQSFARPGKLFTASDSIIARRVGMLTREGLKGLLNAVIEVFRLPDE